jgi:glycosyltransferase involved in cell wall biosynthesis
MRVLMVNQFYPPHIGGAQRHIQLLAHALVERGYDVAVVAQRLAGRPEVEDEDGVRIYRLAGWNSVVARAFANPASPIHPPVRDPGFAAGLERVLERERPDIVHAHGWAVYSFMGLKKKSSAKLLMMLHDYGLACPTTHYVHHDGHHGQACSGPRLAKCVACARHEVGLAKSLALTGGLALSSRTHALVDYYLAGSSAVRDAAIVGAHIPEDKIEVIPYFVPDDIADAAVGAERPAFVPPDAAGYVQFVGRFGANTFKGFDVLLDAYTGLRDAPPLVALLATHGEPAPAVPAGVTVVRDVAHAAVMASWAHCAVAVVPSVWPEPFGQVAIEAMACGKPVVASAVGGLADVVVHEETGLLVPPGDVAALRAALGRLIADPALRERMGAAGRERVERYRARSVIGHIERVYRQLLDPAAAVARV